MHLSTNELLLVDLTDHGRGKVINGNGRNLCRPEQDISSSSLLTCMAPAGILDGCYVDKVFLSIEDLDTSVNKNSPTTPRYKYKNLSFALLTTPFQCDPQKKGVSPVEMQTHTPRHRNEDKHDGFMPVNLTPKCWFTRCSGTMPEEMITVTNRK